MAPSRSSNLINATGQVDWSCRLSFHCHAFTWPCGGGVARRGFDTPSVFQIPDKIRTRLDWILAQVQWMRIMYTVSYWHTSRLISFALCSGHCGDETS